MRRTLAAPSLILLATAIGTCLGCTKPAEPPAQPPPSQPKVLKLVVADRALAQRISRVKGEWKSRSKIDLEIVVVGIRDEFDEASRKADAVIYKPVDLGWLAESGIIRALPAEWLNREEFHKSDLFDPCGLAHCHWGEQIYAVPFGSQVFVLMYRRDIFERFKLEPPRTWTECQHVVESLSAHRSEIPGLEFGEIEELSATMLLARAAAYAKHPDYYGALFDKETMAPLINGPPYVRALEEMIAAMDPKYDASMAADVSAVHKAIFDGRLAMAITTMTAAAVKTGENKDSTASAKLATDDKETAARSADIAFVELPGATEVYNPKSKSWSPNPKGSEPGGGSGVSHVPLLGFSGLIGSVTAQSQSPEAAFQLLAWLSGEEWGSQICPSSPSTTLFRHSQLKQPGRWVEPQLSSKAANQYAEVTAESLSRPQWLTCPRFIARHQDAYMLALDREIDNAAHGIKTPTQALNDVAKRWQEFTKGFGIENQRAAYVRSLGLEL